MTTNDAAKRGRFEKTSEFFAVKDGVAYGWGIVCTEAGKNYWDLQDDHIPEDEMVSAALDFMKNSRVGSDQHTGDHVGDIVFGFPVTKDAGALGIESNKTGFLIGYVPQDKSLLDLIAKGERTGFSIGGYLTEWDDAEVGKASVKKNSPDAGDVYTPAEVGSKNNPAKGKGKKKGKVYRRFKIDEISLVTKPAQEGATVGYVKGLTIAKAYVPVSFTSSDAGHQHVVDPDDFNKDGVGCTSCAITGDGTWHTHEWIKDGDGKIAIQDNAGHGHSTSAVAPAQPYDSANGVTPDEANAGGDVRAPVTIQASAPQAESLTGKNAGRSVQSNKAHNAEPNKMSDTKTEPQDIEKLKTKLIEKDAKIERLEKKLDMSDTERAYYKTLGNRAAKDAFLAKGDGERMVEAKKGLDAMIEFTSSDGTVYYKHDDPRTIKLAKQADEAHKSLVMEKQLRRKAEFAKTATEIFKGAPGEDAVHLAVVEAVQSISDEKVRDAAVDMLKGLNAGFGRTSRATGTGGKVEKSANAGDPIAKAEDKLKQAVSAFQKARNIATYEEAFTLATVEDGATRDAYDEVAELREGAGLDN